MVQVTLPAHGLHALEAFVQGEAVMQVVGYDQWLREEELVVLKDLCGELDDESVASLVRNVSGSETKGGAVRSMDRGGGRGEEGGARVEEGGERG